MLTSVDDPTPAGPSAAEVHAAIAGEVTLPLDWVEQSEGGGVQVSVTPELADTTDLTLALGSIEGQARWIESEAVYPPNANEIAIDCSSRLEFDATLSFATADGVFAEAFDVVVSAPLNFEGELDEAEILREYDPAELAGTLEIVGVEPADYQEIGHEIQIIYPLEQDEDATPRGYVGGYATYERSSGYAIGEYMLAVFGGWEVGE